MRMVIITSICPYATYCLMPMAQRMFTGRIPWDTGTALLYLVCLPRDSCVCSQLFVIILLCFEYYTYRLKRREDNFIELYVNPFYGRK